MRLKKFLVLLISVPLVFSVSNCALADKGSISPWPVSLSQSSQRAIIMHNLEEEVLILGTEIKADRDTYILEFIPFPSEPDVKLASGDPFKEIERLMVEEKGIELIDTDVFKGGTTKTVPIEIKLSEKIGLHDVTLIKINNISSFIDWVKDFFRKKNIDISNDLSNFYKIAEDYVNRGINYFVFDYVPVKTETRLIEPLIYKFKADKIYYPLKTSNIVGGEGIIDLIFILPGSFSEGDYFGLDRSRGIFFELSNSDRVYKDELEDIYQDVNGFFSKVDKLYIQMMRYRRSYDFQNDFFYDPHKLDPRPYIWDWEFIFGYGLRPAEDDYKRTLFYSAPYLTNFEYEVYTALFKSRELKDIVPRRINLVNITLKKQIDMSLSKRFGRAVIEDFNVKNEKEYRLEDFWKSKIVDRSSTDILSIILIDKSKVDSISDTVFYISRVGFNMNKTKALVYLERVLDEKDKDGYLVFLTRRNLQESWKVSRVFKEVQTTDK
ncbi:hypothetical protein H5T89_01645 [bacterium]|nr:hypothetical protein [bacterium]